jgi:molybdopterin molybdotransferase
VLVKGKRLSPFDIGVLAALGKTQVPVYGSPRVALLSSGDEIVPLDVTLPAGKVRDINRYTISGLMALAGCSVQFMGIATDTIEDITERMEAAKESDLILLSGGSSKGQSDFVTMAIERLGGKILFHGINVRPGKPTIFGTLWGKPVFGRFVFPLLTLLSGEGQPKLRTVKARLGVNVASSYGIEEYIRVRLSVVDGDYVVEPLFAKSSVISMLAAADGYIIVPEGAEGLEQGEEVEVFTLG